MAGNSPDSCLSVTDVNRIIRTTLEKSPYLTSIWMMGEISNLTFHSSGHIYFTLKDMDSAISAVFFRNANRRLDFRLEEGMCIQAFGGITVFEKRGSYQFNVSMVKPAGLGELQRRIEELKKKLVAEGIFDPSRKRSLPFLPRRVGIVTSPTGAAVQDIIKVALRRYPNAEILIAPSKVQGDGSAESIVRAIEELNRPEHGIDVIIAGRGGGSFEDLLAFSDEKVVRAYASSGIPIVSAVGHQIDHPLSDDAADVAAPTPSAAAELVFPLVSDLKSEMDYFLLRSTNAINGKIREFRHVLEGFSRINVFRNPVEIINNREMVLADVEGRMTASLGSLVASRTRQLYSIPDIGRLIRNCLEKKGHELARVAAMIDSLSPLGVLHRGYSIARDDRGRIIRSVGDVSQDERVDVQLQDGRLLCNVQSIIPEDVYDRK